VIRYGFVMNYSPVVRDHVRSLYLDGQDPKSIATQLKVSMSAIVDWIREYGWEDLKRNRARAEAHERSDVIIDQEKPQVVERQIRIAEKLDRHIEKALDKKTSKSRDLVNLSKAASGSTGVAESALGLKKAAALQVFVQFNLRPTPIQDALRLGVLNVSDVPPEHLPEGFRPALPMAAGEQVKPVPRSSPNE